MSEFSESFHLRSNDAQEGIALLKRIGLKGIVFKPSNNWVTIVPQAFLHEAVESCVAANQGMLLHYIFAEDHGWEFSVYQRCEQVFHYNCTWESDLIIDDKEAELSVLEDLVEEHIDLSQVDAILHPKSLFEAGTVNHAFAELFGLEHYEWLSGDYLDGFEKEEAVDVVYDDSNPNEQRQRMDTLLETMTPNWVTLRSKAEALLNQQQYTAALEVCQQAIENAEETTRNDPYHEVYLVQLFMDQSRIYLAQRDYPNAVITIDHALERFTTPPTYSYLSWMLSEKIKIHLLQEHAETTMPYIEQLLAYVEEYEGPEGKPYHTLLELAQLYESKQRTDEIERLYDAASEMIYHEAINEYTQAPMLLPIKSITFLEHIVTFYETIQNGEKANRLKEHIEELRGKKKRNKKRKR